MMTVRYLVLSVTFGNVRALDQSDEAVVEAVDKHNDGGGGEAQQPRKTTVYRYIMKTRKPESLYASCTRK